MANKVSVEIDAQVQGFVQGVDKATQSAASYETETRKVADAQVNLMKELKAARKEATNLAAGFALLDKEAKNSVFGQEMARQLNEASEKAAQYINLQGDIRDGLNTLASETAALDILTTGIGALGGAASTAAGMIALFTGNEKDAQRAVVMFTTAQSVLNTVISTYNGIKKIQNVLLVKGITSTTVDTAAQNVNTAAKSKNIIVTKAATIAQAAFNKVAMMNPYVLLAVAIVTVTTAIASFIAFTDDASDSQEEMNKELEEGKKAAEEYRNTVMNAAKEYGEAAAKVKSLLEQLQTMHFEMSKAEIVDQAAEIMKKYGIKCKDATEAEEKLIKLGPKLIEYLQLQGQAAAASALQMAAWSKAIQAALESGKDISVALDEASKDQSYINYGKLVTTIRERTSALEKELGIHKKIYEEDKKNSKNTDKKTKVTVDYEVGSLEELKKKRQESIDKLQKKNLSLIDIENEKKKLKDLDQQIEQREIELGIKVVPKKGSVNYWKKIIDDIDDSMANGIERAVSEGFSSLEEEKKHAERELEKEEIRLGIKVEPPKISKIKEIQKIFEEAFNPKKEYDFSSLPEKYGEAADELLEKQRSLVEGKKRLEQEMQDSNSDADIAATQDMIDATEAEIQKNKELLDTYQQMNEEQKERIKNAKKLAETYDHVAEAAGYAGDMFSSLAEIADSNPALNVAGIIADTIAKMFQGYANATVAAAETGNPWVWASFSLAALAQTLAMVAQIKSATAGNYANGGIVPGNSYSGDRLSANVNSGEMILNKRQQQNLFNMLDTSSMPTNGGTNVTVTGVIRGTDIMLVQKNTNKVLSKAGSKINF